MEKKTVFHIVFRDDDGDFERRENRLKPERMERQ